jgi:hypothetical protein
MTTELVPYAQQTLPSVAPSARIAAATEIADVLSDVVRSRGLSVRLQGREYVLVDGWTTLAALAEVSPTEISVERLEPGDYLATVELMRRDGTELARASALCGTDEKAWGSRPEYARRSMAITRATGKACRIAFGWIMRLAGYESTPAEEMPARDEDDRPEIAPPPKQDPVKAGLNALRTLAPQKGLSCDQVEEGFPRKASADEQVAWLRTRYALVRDGLYPEPAKPEPAPKPAEEPVAEQPKRGKARAAEQAREHLATQAYQAAVAERIHAIEEAVKTLLRGDEAAYQQWLTGEPAMAMDPSQVLESAPRRAHVAELDRILATATAS